MSRREASINDHQIATAERRIFGPALYPNSASTSRCGDRHEPGARVFGARTSGPRTRSPRRPVRHTGPIRVLALGQDSIKALGTSRSKARYLINLAEHVETGALDIENMDDISDVDAVRALVAVKGIGIWSAEMFLIHQLHRPDVFPAGDVGLRNAIQRVCGIPEPLSIPRAQVLSLGWRQRRRQLRRTHTGSRQTPAPRGCRRG
jgi:hypothetical protein